MTARYAPEMNIAWLNRLSAIFHHGNKRSPRGKKTLDQANQHFVVDMMQPVLTIPGRKLSYRFMAAEAYWILSGDNTVEGIAPWNRNIAAFSDNGAHFFGAYGPKVIGQLPYVVQKLRKDRDTRQAGLTIWHENPPETKDYPCTIAVWFTLDESNELHLSAFMRSSDVWLGLPYDVFNFSMLACYVCSYLNTLSRDEDGGDSIVIPGYLTITAVSSHLYEDQWEMARELLDSHDPAASLTPRLPLGPMAYSSTKTVMETLRVLRDSKPGDPTRWWEKSL